MRASTMIFVGMAAYASAQDLASLSSQLASLTSGTMPTDDASLDAAQSSLSSLLPSLESAASAAQTSFASGFAGLDPAAQSSVAAGLSSLGIDYGSLTEGVSGASQTAEASASQTGDDDSSAQSTGSSDSTGSTTAGSSAASTGSASGQSASSTDAEGIAAATAIPIAAIGAGLALIGML
ncbi:hypothetical protein WHR41_07100 [Cladosporium halotolerans]|uniref:Uncharacterized protein n=1 Tax=Cladosporium halotolerans TaxID=1052096 RepID=A0AB34KL82_9PEZI